MLLNLGIMSRVMDRSRPARKAALPDGQGRRARSVRVRRRAIRARHRSGQRRAPVRARDRLPDRRSSDRLRQLGADYARGPYREAFACRFRRVEPAGVERGLRPDRAADASFVIANGFVVHNAASSRSRRTTRAISARSTSRGSRSARRDGAGVDWDELERVVRLAVRFLDDVIEVNPYPLAADRRDGEGQPPRRARRHGLGGSALHARHPLRQRGSARARRAADGLRRRTGHDQSARLAEERGPFPSFGRSIYRHGRPLRNATVTTIAPTGTISMIAGCSSGIEPVFALAFEHRVKGPRRRARAALLQRDLRAARPVPRVPLRGPHDRGGPPRLAAGRRGRGRAARAVFKTAHEIDSPWHVRHQAAFQKHTDNGVSKTINLPETPRPNDVAAAYRLAWEQGCLGITVFRDGCKGTQVLNMGVRAEGARDAVAAGRARRQAAAAQPDRGHLPDGDADRDRLHHRERHGRRRAVRGLRAGRQGGIGHDGGGGGPRPARLARAAAALAALRRPRLEEVDQPALAHRRRPADRLRRRQGALAPGRARAHARRAHRAGARRRPAAPRPRRPARRPIGDLCRECGQATLVYEEGCKKCLSCGFNEC